MTIDLICKDGVACGGKGTKFLKRRSSVRCSECNLKREQIRRSKGRYEVEYPDGTVRLYVFGSDSVRRARDRGLPIRKVSIDGCSEIETELDQPERPSTGAVPEFDRCVSIARRANYTEADRAWESTPRGYVYIARQPGGEVVKIGHSRQPKDRMSSVNTFTVPGKEWYIVSQFLVEDRKSAEKMVHMWLSDRRIGNKELFGLRRDLIDMVQLVGTILEPFLVNPEDLA